MFFRGLSTAKSNSQEHIIRYAPAFLFGRSAYAEREHGRRTEAKNGSVKSYAQI